MNDKKIDMKLLVRVLVTILAIALLATLVFGEETVSNYILYILVYTAILFYAMYSSLHLANSFSNKYTVFGIVLIPRLIVFILLSIFIDHRMIYTDILISFIVDKIAYRIGKTRLLIDNTKDIIKEIEGE